jgi:predicted flap endonuclease-1-like 5' DNA nuclease
LNNQEPEDISRWIQELISRSTREQIQAMQRLSNLVQRMASGELDQGQVRQEYTRFVKDESTRYVEDLTRLGLSFQAALVELNRKYSDRFFDQVMGSPLNEVPAPNGQGPQRKEVALSLSGAVGDELEKSFVIENKRADEETVIFLVSEFTDAQSTQSFRPPLQLQPARLTLRPGEERLVTLRLPLLKELFQPGQIYFATVVARGHSDVVLSLRVDVARPAAEAEITIREQPASPASKAAPRPKPVAPADDLTRIKGIGPAFAEKLAAAGVATYADLGAASARKLHKVLGETDYQRLKREGWQEQARAIAKPPPKPKPKAQPKPQE